MKIIDYITSHGYEQVVFCHDSGIGLRAIIAIHDTTLGPALGGVRLWDYSTEDEAILDALRLAQAMTYKAAVSGLNLGGGKAVIMGPCPAERREAFFRSLGRFIQSLGGRYIATEDVGTYVPDMEAIRTQTKFVTGLPRAMGGSGDPSAFTALGVFEAMKACAKEVFGSPSLKGKRIAVQGVGKVGYHLLKHLHDEGVELVVADINAEAAHRAERQFGVGVVEPDKIFDLDCHIFSPCALGAVLNNQTIPRFKCQIICGGANNQLESEKDGEVLEGRGILYAPDFIANAGGLINVSLEISGYSEELAYERVRGIYHTMERVISRAKEEKVTTFQAANKLAEERLAAVRAMKGIYKGDQATP